MGTGCSSVIKGYRQPTKVTQGDTFGELRVEQYRQEQLQRDPETTPPLIGSLKNSEVPFQEQGRSLLEVYPISDRSSISAMFAFSNSEHARKLMGLHQKGTRDVTKLAEDFLFRVRRATQIRQNISARSIQQMWKKWRELKKSKAATKIQAVYRGHRVRKKGIMETLLEDEFSF